jgi:predicted Holliday junction resolvase-like endonuclease
MDAVIGILLFLSIICVIYLVLDLQKLNKSTRELKNNADNLALVNTNLEDQLTEHKNSTHSHQLSLTNLETRLTEEKSSHQARESNLHKAISGLQEALSEEQKSLKSRETELKKKESDLESNLVEVQKNLEEETESRKKVLSQKKSSEVRLGHIAETLAPFLDQFDFDPENCTFLGKPIDYISFDDDAVTLIEIKSGKSQLNSKQRHIRDLVKNNQVNWKEIRIQ